MSNNFYFDLLTAFLFLHIFLSQDHLFGYKSFFDWLCYNLWWYLLVNNIFRFIPFWIIVFVWINQNKQSVNSFKFWSNIWFLVVFLLIFTSFQQIDLSSRLLKRFDRFWLYSVDKVATRTLNFVSVIPKTIP